MDAPLFQLTFWAQPANGSRVIKSNRWKYLFISLIFWCFSLIPFFFKVRSHSRSGERLSFPRLPFGASGAFRGTTECGSGPTKGRRRPFGRKTECLSVPDEGKNLRFWRWPEGESPFATEGRVEFGFQVLLAYGPSPPLLGANGVIRVATKCGCGPTEGREFPLSTVFG